MEILNKNIEEGLVHPVLANRLLKSHFNLENVKEFLKATDLVKVKDIVLLHLSDGNSNAAEFKEEIQRLTGKPVYIADKGLEIEMFDQRGEIMAKRYYWLKLKEDFFDDDNMQWIEEQPNGDKYELFYLKLCLKA